MINSPIIDAKFTPPAPPRHKPKTEESAEIARLVDEFLAKGGVIKTGHGNKIDKQQDFIIGDAFVVWPNREYVGRLMSEKLITIAALTTKTKIRRSLLEKFLRGEQLPDNREREIILNAVENWGIKL